MSSFIAARRAWRLLVVAAACAAAPGIVAAQSAEATDASAADRATVQASAAPNATSATVATVATTATASLAAAIAPSGAETRRARSAAPVEQSATATVAMQDNTRVGKGLALVLVGAAGVVTGMLVGDDAGAAIAVGGAVIGLYGLYRMLR